MIPQQTADRGHRFHVGARVSKRRKTTLTAEYNGTFRLQCTSSPAQPPLQADDIRNQDRIPHIIFFLFKKKNMKIKPSR